jgi:hypothetical protein
MPTVSKHPAYCWRVDARASGQHDSPIAGVHTDDSLRLSLSGDVEMAAQVNRGTRRKVEQQQDGIRLLVQAEADGSLRFPDGDRPSARPWCCQAGRQTICKTVYLSVRPSVPAYPTNVADRRLLCYSSDTKSMLNRDYRDENYSALNTAMSTAMKARFCKSSASPPPTVGLLRCMPQMA